MKDYSLIPGYYTWTMKKVRLFSNKRIVMLILKGGRPVGHLTWHPSAKSICYDGKYWNTPELLDFVRPYMDKKRFYMAWKIHKLLDKNQE